MLTTNMRTTTLRSVALLTAGLLLASGSLGCRSSGSGKGAHGCSSCGTTAAAVPPARNEFAAAPQAAASATGGQRTCPVTGQELGSMGPPVAVNVAGRTVYVCCAGCSRAVQQDPDKYLAAVDAELRGSRGAAGGAL